MSFLTVVFFLWVSITAYASPLLDKRGFDGQATYFAVGLGACGQWNVASDYIVALNTPQYGSGSPGPECFKKITITYNGKSIGATIMDECPTCAYGSLDLSQGLFQAFAPTSLGEFPMTWVYDGAAAPAPPPQTSSSSHWEPKPPPTPTSTPEPTSSHHSTTHSTTTTTTHTSHTTTKSLSSSTTTTWSSSISPSPPLPSLPADSDGNLQFLNTFVLSLGNLVALAAGVNVQV